MQRLLEIMARLRDPQGGCPWDREQTFTTIAPHTIEEAYEVAEAIRTGDMDELREELGDLLFQIAFYTQMSREQGGFGFDEVVEGICAKMLRRHPHVFGDAEVKDAEEQTRRWEAHKAEERRRKAGERPPSQLDGVALALPAMVRAHKLQRRAAEVGFDWPAIQGVVAKLREETAELEAELGETPDPVRERAEIGDLLFTCVNLARHAGADGETLLREANHRFESRFRAMEASAAGQGVGLRGLDTGALDGLWEQAKRGEGG